MPRSSLNSCRWTAVIVLVLMSASAAFASGKFGVGVQASVGLLATHGPEPARALLRLDELDAEGIVVPKPTSEAKPPSSRALRRIDKARRLRAEQRFTEAALEIERALQTDPDCYEVHLALARTLRAAGSTDRCTVHLERAAELRGDDIALHYLLAMAAIEQQDDDNAIRSLRIALVCPNAEATPDVHALVLYHLAKLLEREGFLTAALDALARFQTVAAGIGLDSDVDEDYLPLRRTADGQAELAKSRILEQLERFGEAADALTQAITEMPADVAAQTRLVELLSKAGRHEDAVAKAKQLLMQDSSAVGVLLDAQRQAGHPERAADDLAAIAADRPDDADLLIAYVTILEDLGRGDEAQARLVEFIEAHPDRVDLRWRLFDLYAGRSAWAEALATATQAVRHDHANAIAARSKLLQLPSEQEEQLLDVPVDPNADDATLYLLGCVALNVDRHEQAARYLQIVVDRTPEFDEARTELAALYVAQYRWSDVVSLLEELSDQGQAAASAQYLLGRAYDGLDDDEQAVQHLSAAARLNPQDSRPVKALAKHYERKGETLRAIRQYRSAIEIDPLDADALESLFSLYVGTGDRDAAATALAELRAISASPNRLARCVAVLQNDSQEESLDRFRSVLTEAMDASQPDARSLMFIGWSYLREARYADALTAFQQAADLAPRDLEVLDSLSAALRLTLDFSASEELVRKLLSWYPNRTEWILELIDVLVIEQDFDAAIDVIGDRLARSGLTETEQTRYRNQLLEVLEAARRYDRRIELLEEWSKEDPDNKNYRGPLMQAYMDAGRSADIIERAEAWLDDDPLDDDLRRQVVALLLDAERSDRACQLVLERLNDDPDNDDLQLLLVATLNAAGRYDEALELATNCVVQTNEPLAFQMQMLQVYDAAGRHDDAVKVVGELLHQVDQNRRQGIQLDENILQRLWASHLIQAERYNEAQVKLTRWIRETSLSAEKFQYLSLLSACHQQRGQRAQSIEALEQAYDLRPLDAGVNNDLAYSWADEGMHLEEAEKRMRYAVAQQPRNDAFLDSLGWVLYKRGDFDAAIVWLNRAVGAGPGTDPVIRNHLGDACWRAGRHDEAVANWQASEENAVERLKDKSLLNAAEYQRVLEAVRAKLAQVKQGDKPELAPIGESEADDAQPVENQVESQQTVPALQGG